MDSRLTLICLACSLLGIRPIFKGLAVNATSSFSADQYEVHEEGTWEKSLEICGQRAVKLTDLDQHNSITHLLDKRQIHAVWLPSSRIVYNTYKWLDQSDLDHDVARMGRQLGYSCGVLDVALGIYDFRPCETKGLSYLCEIKDCLRCSDQGHTSHDCMADKSTCYIFSCGAGNWYEAKVKCVQMNGRLAVVKTQADLKPFMSLWKRDFLGPCSNAWLGLRLEEWTRLEHSSVSLWAPGEPRQGLNCMLLQNNSGEYVWKAANCSEEYFVVCEQTKAKKLMKPSSTTEFRTINTKYLTTISKSVTTHTLTYRTATECSYCKWKGLLMVITVILCVQFMIILLVAGIWLKKIRRRQGGNNRSEGEEEHGETTKSLNPTVT